MEELNKDFHILWQLRWSVLFREFFGTFLKHQDSSSVLSSICNSKLQYCNAGLYQNSSYSLLITIPFPSTPNNVFLGTLRVWAPRLGTPGTNDFYSSRNLLLLKQLLFLFIRNKWRYLVWPLNYFFINNLKNLYLLSFIV